MGNNYNVSPVIDHEKVIEGSTASEQTAEPAVVASPEVTAVQAEAKDQDAGQSPAPVR